MNSKQPFGTRDFAHGRWGQCGDESLQEALDQLFKKHGRKKVFDALDEKRKKASMLSKNRINMPMSRKRFDRVMDVFEPMFEMDDDARSVFWNSGAKDASYAEVVIRMSKTTVDMYEADKTIN